MLSRYASLLASACLTLACSTPEQTAESGETGETGESGESDTEQTDTDAEPSYDIELQDRSCDFNIPSGRSADCYTLVVPLDRAMPEEGVVELAVAVLHPQGAATRAPVVYLHGGPGGDVIDAAANYFNLPLVDDGDLVLIDQRGSGLSLPNLDCPEVGGGWYEAFSASGTASEEIALLREAYGQCHTRLSAEVELSAFNTSANADDLDDLRRALGLDTWSIYGISYGTRVGLELMRRHGEHIERAVLDSVYPPQVGGVDWMLDSAQEALERLIAGCLDEVVCGATFPNLAENLETAVANLDAEPYLLTVEDPEGVAYELRLGGADFYAGMYNALYDVELIPVVPLLIFQASQGNYGFLSDLADQSIPFLTGLAEGARVSIDCADGGLFHDPVAVDAAVASNPNFSTLFGAYALPYCELWQVEAAPQSFLDGVESDVPTLLLAGEFDPVTPVAQTELAAEGLSASEYYNFPGYGHGVSFDSDCAKDMTRAFFRDGAVDPACWSALPTETL